MSKKRNAKSTLAFSAPSILMCAAIAQSNDIKKESSIPTLATKEIGDSNA